jgi:hypothetical protein
MRFGWKGVGIVVGVAFLLGSVAVQADPEKPNRKMMRQIRIMEKILDEVLVDSPNLLVFNDRPTRGFYLDGFGAVFTLEASLVREGTFDFSFLKNFRIEKEDGKVIIVTRDKGSGDEDEDEEENGEEEVSEAELYERGKQELKEALVDYAETLSSLKDDDWVAVVAFLKGSSYFTDRKISRLILKVRMRDLRGVERNEALRRIREEEF